MYYQIVKYSDTPYHRLMHYLFFLALFDLIMRVEPDFLAALQLDENYLVTRRHATPATHLLRKVHHNEWI